MMLRCVSYGGGAPGTGRTVSWLQVRPDSGCPLGLGNDNGYRNRGCRCDACREANTARHLDYMQRHPEQYVKQQRRNRLQYNASRAAGPS